MKAENCPFALNLSTWVLLATNTLPESNLLVHVTAFTILESLDHVLEIEFELMSNRARELSKTIKRLLASNLHKQRMLGMVAFLWVQVFTVILGLAIWINPFVLQINIITINNNIKWTIQTWKRKVDSRIDYSHSTRLSAETIRSHLVNRTNT